MAITKSRCRALADGGGKALAEHAARNVQRFLVHSFDAAQLLAGGQAVRRAVAQQAVERIDEKGGDAQQKAREAQHERRDGRAPVRRAQRGEGGDAAGHAQAPDHVFRVQPALGMGDDVHLLRVRAAQNLIDFPLELRGVARDRAHAVHAAFIDFVALDAQQAVDAAEGTHEKRVLHAQPVHQHDGIAGLHAFFLLSGLPRRHCYHKRAAAESQGRRGA